MDIICIANFVRHVYTVLASELQSIVVIVVFCCGVLLLGRGRVSCPWQAKAAKAQTQTQQVWTSNDLECICSSGL